MKKNTLKLESLCLGINSSIGSSFDSNLLPSLARSLWLRLWDDLRSSLIPSFNANLMSSIKEKRKILLYESGYSKVNVLRELCGMRPIEPKQRRCLKCDASFISYGPSNRLCKEHGVHQSERHHIFHKPHGRKKKIVSDDEKNMK
jgi:hypothetical protein